MIKGQKELQSKDKAAVTAILLWEVNFKTKTVCLSVSVFGRVNLIQLWGRERPQSLQSFTLPDGIAKVKGQKEL